MIHWGKIFYFLHGSLRMKRKNLLRSRMVYDPLGKNILFPSWLTEDGKEKLTEEKDGIQSTREKSSISFMAHWEW